MMKYRTDLAIEAKRLWDKSAEEKTKLCGVSARQTEHCGIPVNIVKILNKDGASALRKPIGTYVTVELDSFLCRERESFRKTAEAICAVLRNMIPTAKKVLVVGLGNANITADAIGPETLNNLVVTRHLTEKEIPAFHGFCSVSAVAPGVLGRTGLESVELVAGAVERVKPEIVLAIDALASCEPDRLCASVQVSDTGIVPGSGIGNHRCGFTEKTLGVPVYAIGVPTIVDGGTFLATAGAAHTVGRKDLVLTTRDIDRQVRDIGRLIGFGLDLALQHRLTFHDIPGFLS